MASGTISEHHSEIERLKQAAAKAAASQLESGMIVGLGSGTTSTLAVAEIGKRVQEGLKIIAIPTSEKTAAQANDLGIQLSTLGEYPEIDVAIDGADEVESGTLNLIKGGGGNQLREKIVANASKRFVVIVDETKISVRLGSHAKVPVEVAQFGWQATARSLDKLRGNPALRMSSNGEPYITDGGNYILDCAFGPIPSAAALDNELNGIVGVLEHGLFIGMASQVLVGTPDGVRNITRE